MSIQTRNPKIRDMSQAEIESIVRALQQCRFRTRLGACAYVARQVGRSKNLVLDIAQGHKYAKWSGGRVSMKCDTEALSPREKRQPIGCRYDWFDGSPVSILISTRPWTRAGLKGLGRALKEERPQ